MVGGNLPFANPPEEVPPPSLSRSSPSATRWGPARCPAGARRRPAPP